MDDPEDIIVVPLEKLTLLAVTLEFSFVKIVRNGQDGPIRHFGWLKNQYIGGAVQRMWSQWGLGGCLSNSPGTWWNGAAGSKPKFDTLIFDRNAFTVYWQDNCPYSELTDCGKRGLAQRHVEMVRRDQQQTLTVKEAEADLVDTNYLYLCICVKGCYVKTERRLG
jgi:hypothetical protein